VPLEQFLATRVGHYYASLGIAPVARERAGEPAPA
jgi:hypothetical protein